MRRQLLWVSAWLVWRPVTVYRSGTVQSRSWLFSSLCPFFLMLFYVILENHLHLIAAAPRLSSAIQAFKSYTARRILDLLEERKAHVLLSQLQAQKLRHKVRSQFQCLARGQPTETNRRRRDDVAKTGVHAQQPSGPRLRGRSVALALLQRTQLCRPAGLDRGGRRLEVNGREGSGASSKGEFRNGSFGTRRGTKAFRNRSFGTRRDSWTISWSQTTWPERK